MIVYSLPEFIWNGFSRNKAYVELLDRHPEWFIDGLKIGSIYGSFPNAIWNGGRIVLGNATKQDVHNVLNLFNGAGVGIRYTFTNLCLEKKHLGDVWCNLLMDELAKNKLNSVNVSSDLLEDYIRTNWPNVEVVSSTTKVLDTVVKANIELDTFPGLVVLHYGLNNDEEYLKSIKYPERCELLVDEYCGPNCPRRKAHYKFNSKGQLMYENVEWSNSKLCRFDNYMGVMARPHYLSREKVQYLHDTYGYYNFKIAGRGVGYIFVNESYLQHLAKPEYMDQVRMTIEPILFNQ